MTRPMPESAIRDDRAARARALLWDDDAIAAARLHGARAYEDILERLHPGTRWAVSFGKREGADADDATGTGEAERHA